ncbi:LAQU0S11e02476g1_1 [Lachancea quebecensis]|uniref:LAQU0S11e02476g1_1 n=1 Tax=Lachancea quebecensis TaxID=1654605 RepID=A0A0P1KUU3_9SACH|nr:LAQU0S11e02476g1_1 [Lachancea quebecensis]
MSDSEPESVEFGNEKTVVVAKRVLRRFLSLCESQSTIISRAKLSTIIREVSSEENTRTIKFGAIYKAMNSLLRNSFGYQLWGLYSKPSKSTKGGKRSGTSRDHTPEDTEFGNNGNAVNLKEKAHFFMLVSDLPEAPVAFRSLLLEEGAKLYEDRFVDDNYIGNDLSMQAQDSFENAVATDESLVAQGLTFVILVLILFSKNSILHQELVQHLLKFGIPQDGQNIPVIDMTLNEFLNLLIKREFIHRTEERAQDGTQEVSFYRIGRKTQLEFDKKSLLAMCFEIMEPDAAQMAQLEKSIELSIADAYGA